MKTKFIIPVIDTERLKFEYHGKAFSTQEFEIMEYEKFLRTDKQVARFVDNMAKGISNFDNNSIGGRFKNVSNKDYPDLFFNFEESEGIALNSKFQEIGKDTFDNLVQNGKMFILNLNFNPSSLSEDAESEMRFWLEDSIKVINDKSISDELKLRTLPDRYFWIVVEGKPILLNKCKIVQNNSSKKAPYSFSIIVEKATYDGTEQQH